MPYAARARAHLASGGVTQLSSLTVARRAVWL